MSDTLSVEDHKHTVWNLIPEQISGEVKRLSGYHLQTAEPVNTRLVQDSEILTQPATLLSEAGTYAREHVSGMGVKGKCLEVTARTVARLHTQYGIPATTQRFWVSDGTRIEPHYATVASVPETDYLDWFPYEDRWCRHVSDLRCLKRVIVDPSLSQFTDQLSFSLHPTVDCEVAINPVEVVREESPLAPVYRPMTIEHYPQTLWS